MRAMTDNDWAYIVYFHKGEFRNPSKMSYDFLRWLDTVRSRAKVAMSITSDQRSHDHNVQVGGAEDSAHLDEPCSAVDVTPNKTAFDPHGNNARFRIVRAAIELGCTRIGIYPNGSIHLDMSNRIQERLWVKVDNPAHN